MKHFALFLAVAILVSCLGIVQAQRGLYELPDPFGDPVSISSPIALTRSGRILVSNPFVNRVSIIGLERSLDAEFDIGNAPSSVAILPNNLQAVALSAEKLVLIDLQENTISAEYRLEAEAAAMVVNETTAYIALQSSDEIIAMSLEDGSILSRILTPPAPSGLALWGNYLYVSHFYSGDFSLIYLPSAEVVRTIQTDANAGLSASIEINPIHGKAYLPQSLRNSNASEIDNQLRPMVYEVDLRTMTVLQAYDLGEALEGSAAIPYAARQPSNRSRLYISLSGSNGFVVLNLDTGRADNFVETGVHPRGLIFSPNYGRIYLQDALEGSVSVFDTRFFGLEDQIPNSSESLSAQSQIAASLFYTSDSRLNPSGMLTCASCHWQGQMTNFAVTNSLIFGDDFEADWLNEHIHMRMGGAGLPVESIDMDALIAFLRND